MASTRIAAMIRTASRLPEGDFRVAFISLMMREAAFGGLQLYAAEQFLSGLMEEKISKITKMMREDKRLEKTNPPAESRLRVPNLVQTKDLQRANTSEIKAALNSIGIADLAELVNTRLWDFTERMASKRIGKGDLSANVPGTAGVSGEDIAQVLGVGGITWPGMVWDGRKKAYVDRTKNVYDLDKAIFWHAGKAARDRKFSGVGGLLKWLMKPIINKTSNFIRSVDAGAAAKFEYDRDGERKVDSLGYEPAPVSEYLTQERHLQRIDGAMRRELSSAPGQLLVWELLMDAIEEGKDLLKSNRNSGKLTVKAGELRKHALAKLEEKFGEISGINPATEKPYADMVPSPQTLQKNFDKILPKMKKSMEYVIGTPDEDDGSDWKSTFEDLTSPRTAASVIASGRSAMIRLASILPVGSPERRAILAGCEKLPEGPMRDNCEKKKEEGASDKKAGKGKVPDALKKHQFTSDDNPNPKGNDKDGDGKSGEKKPFESKKKSARVKSKRESMGMMNDLRKKHGDGTKAYYQAVIDEVKAGVIAPSAVVGGGYKNGKKVAIEWLEGQMKGKKAALVRLAATLPVGSSERKTILRMAAGDLKQA